MATERLVHCLDTDQETLQCAISRLLESLSGQGDLAIVDNRPDECGSLFLLEDGEVTPIASINGGAETESLVQGLACMNGRS